MKTNYKIAPSYHDAEIISINEETHKAYIKTKCPRCNGLGFIVSRIENNKMIPIPVDGGICYKCNNQKYIYKWVKAYTEVEYERYIKTQERAKEKRVEKEKARIQSLKDNSEENKKELLAKWNFDVEDPAVYLVTGNTFDIKDELKERGGRFNPALNWHFTKEVEVPEGHELVKVPFDKVYTWMPMVKRFELKEDAKEVAAAARIAAMPESKSEWIGDIKQRLRQIKVTLSSARAISGFYGDSVLFTFEQGDNILVWFASNPPEIEEGHEYLLTGTVVEHKEYNGVKQTRVNRCKLETVA